MSNLRTSVTVEVQGSPEKVFGVLTDPTRMPEWVNGVESAEWAPGSTLKTGGRFGMKYKYARRTHDVTMEITVVTPNTKLEYHTVEGPYPIEATFELSDVGDNTSVTYTQNAIADSKLSSIGFMLTGWFAKSMVRKNLRKDLAKLDAAVQATI